MSQKFVVVDFEATCAPDNDTVGGDFFPEIVEIGWCVVNLENLVIEGPENLLVKPRFTEIGPKLARLTGLQPDVVARQGVSFEAACRLLRDRKFHKLPWGSWGAWDAKCLNTNLGANGLIGVTPLGLIHVDLKRVYWLLRLRGRGRPMSLRRALNAEQLAQEGPRHRAGWDAYGAARLFTRLLEVTKELC